VLANSGVGCTHLSDGALLATELATTSYDCVILDRCCGVSDLISKVRSRHASLPVLVLAPHDSSSAEAAELAGADEVLPFPVHHSALMGALFLLTTAAKVSTTHRCDELGFAQSESRVYPVHRTYLTVSRMSSCLELPAWIEFDVQLFSRVLCARK
jgi:DNA-binding response OmpR family regulator